MAYEAVRLAPIGGSLGHPVRAHQIDDIRASMSANLGQFAIGRCTTFLILNLLQGRAEGWHLPKDWWQIFIAA
ncbi:hypothetical protein D9M71_731960 [compost metagenome]